MKKKCKKCDKEKELKSFSRSPTTKDGLHIYCKRCDSDIHYLKTENKVKALYDTYNKWKNNFKELEKMCDLFDSCKALHERI